MAQSLHLVCQDFFNDTVCFLRLTSQETHHTLTCIFLSVFLFGCMCFIISNLQLADHLGPCLDQIPATFEFCVNDTVLFAYFLDDRSDGCIVGVAYTRKKCVLQMGIDCAGSKGNKEWWQHIIWPCWVQAGGSFSRDSSPICKSLFKRWISVPNMLPPKKLVSSNCPRSDTHDNNRA